MARALLIKFGAIGDVVMAIPAAHALFLGGYTVDWVCGRSVVPVLALYPWIRTIVGDDAALVHGSNVQRVQALAGIWRGIAGRSYDLCATLYYDRRYRLLALPVRARRKLMLSRSGRTSQLLPGRHHTDEYARLLLQLKDGVRPVGLRPVRPGEMPSSPLARDGRARVVLAPAGARNALREDNLRRWPIESYAETARQLVVLGIDVVLVGGPEDRWAEGAFAGLAVTNCIGKFSLAETIGLFDQGDVLLTHDTGPMHLAGITSIGIVSVFGPTDPYGRLPQRANAVALWGGEGFACRPCYDGRNYAPCDDNQCMQQVTVAAVVREVLRMIEQKAGAGRPPRVLMPESTVRP